jgi:hypothetical protein
MASDTPRLDGLDPERIAELASRFLREAETYSRADHEATAFMQAAAYAAMGILGEVHKMRLALDELVAR